MPLEWKGVFPALTTKFTANDELDLALFSKNLSAQVDSGVNGIILGGSLGEASVLTIAEKEKLVKHSLEHLSGKIPVVLNIAEGATKDAINAAKKAKEWGVQ